jgi:biotin-[acetyl-CoA-carboxylase] ligase BirA-like protein
MPADEVYRQETWSGFRVDFLREVDSTSTRALAAGEDEVAYVADAQTAGRGRRSAPWHSAPGRGLWMSIALRCPPQDLGFVAVLAVRDALRGPAAPGVEAPLGAGAALTVKWPNDLLLAGRKVCGVLVEHRAGISAVGIGLNIAQEATEFPEDLREVATSLREAGWPLAAQDAHAARDLVLRSLLAGFRARLDALRAGRRTRSLRSGALPSPWRAGRLRAGRWRAWWRPSTATARCGCAAPTERWRGWMAGRWRCWDDEVK